MPDADPTTWPDGHRAAVMFTFDLDAEEAWRVKKEQDPEYDRPLLQRRGRFGATTAVPRILDLFEEHDLRCTFFIPGKVMEAYPDLSRRVDDAGHEVAHHGYTHRPPSQLAPAEQRTEIERGLEVFEEVLGTQPTGYRSPLNEFSEHTVDLLTEFGFDYDSSLIDADLPYLHDGGDGSLVEIPNELSLEDWPYFGFNYDPPTHYSGGIAPIGDVLETWYREFQGVHHYGRYFLLTLHPQLIGRPGRMRMLDELITRIESTDDTWIATGEEIAEHWLTHHAGD
jgi:peptidoglycan/xylan/chitin deacetylase (PgdA/CDA1 family)